MLTFWHTFNFWFKHFHKCSDFWTPLHESINREDYLVSICASVCIVSISDLCVNKQSHKHIQCLNSKGLCWEHCPLNVADQHMAIFKGSHSLRPACTSKALRSNLTFWITINYCNGREAMSIWSANMLPQVGGSPLKMKKTKPEWWETSLGLSHLWEHCSIKAVLLSNRAAGHSHGRKICYKRTGHVAFGLTEAHIKLMTNRE